MKRAFTHMLITMLLCLMAVGLYAEGDYMIYRNNGKPVTIKQMAAELVNRQVVFFGEYHDDAVCHALELELLTEMHAVNPKVVVSMEMFERDAQDILIDYLADRTTEEIFLRESRPWPNPHPSCGNPQYRYSGNRSIRSRLSSGEKLLVATIVEDSSKVNSRPSS